MGSTYLDMPLLTSKATGPRFAVMSSLWHELQRNGHVLLAVEIVREVTKRLRNSRYILEIPLAARYAGSYLD